MQSIDCMQLEMYTCCFNLGLVSLRSERVAMQETALYSCARQLQVGTSMVKIWKNRHPQFLAFHALFSHLSPIRSKHIAPRTPTADVPEDCQHTCYSLNWFFFQAHRDPYKIALRGTVSPWPKAKAEGEHLSLNIGFLN